jgi:hypothetical protein
MYATEYHRPANGPKPTELRVYDSIAEVVDRATSKSSPRPKAEDSICSTTFTGRAFRTWNGIRTAANTMWSDGLDILDGMTTEIAAADIPAPVSRKRKMRFDEANGDEIDYDRLRSGQDFWRTCRRDNVRGPATVTVMVDVSANSSVDHADILWRGAAAIAMTDLLEEAGYRVELWAVEGGVSTYVDGAGSMIAVCLKQAAEVLDRSTLINAVSGWFFRTIMFAEISYSHCNREVDCGLGQHSDPTQADAMEITGSDNCFIITDAFTREDAIDRVKDILNSLN